MTFYIFRFGFNSSKHKIAPLSLLHIVTDDSSALRGNKKGDGNFLNKNTVTKCVKEIWRQLVY